MNKSLKALLIGMIITVSAFLIGILQIFTDNWWVRIYAGLFPIYFIATLLIYSGIKAQEEIEANKENV